MLWKNPNKLFGQPSISPNLRLLSLFPGGPVVKNLPTNAGDMGSIPGVRGFHVPYSNQATVPQLLSPHAYSL